MIEQEVFFERLKEQREKDLPFVAYKVSTEKTGRLRAFLQHSQEIYTTKKFSETGFVFSPFDIQKDAILFPKKNCDTLETVFNESEVVSLFAVADPSVSRSTHGKGKHIDLVKKGITAIREGRFKKVVLSRKEVLQTGNLDAIVLFRKLLKKYPDAFVYLMHHPKIGTWLGATPEKLLEVQRNRFRTMALAGTQKYKDTMDVEWGEKEREEQQIVTDNILDNLKGSITNIKTTGPYTTRAGALLHLRTDIEGELISDKGNLKNLIEALHPTPAVCGLPKDEAKDFILENENYDRAFYTGFLGELNIKTERKRSNNRRNQENLAYGAVTNTTALYVNLRCMKLEQNRAEIFVGGGITGDSDPEAEWEETQNKAETMKAVLNK